jgi:tetratricopeptide (TPR) repeat protein
MPEFRVRWTVVGLLAAAVAVASGMDRAGIARAQEGPADDGSPPGADAGEAGDAGGDGEKKPEQKDPSDVRNAIGNLSLVRGFERLARPVKKGLWAQLVDQPYYTPAVRARKLLFFGQYDEAEAKYNTLLKESPGNQEYIEGDLEAILRQGHAADLKRFTARLASLTDAQRGTAKVTRLRAEALEQAGQPAEALSLLRGFADAHPKLDKEDGEALAAVMMYGRLLERQAAYAAAAGVYRGLLPLAEGKLPDDAQAATQLALALYRSSTLAGDGREKHRSVLYQLSQVRDNDATYWPAILAEADILIACHNENDGGKAVDEVLDLNPNELQARFLAVDHAIGGYNFDVARQQLDEIKRRTDGPEGFAYEGRLLLKERLPEKAVAPLLEALKKDPTLARARGWLAGAYYLTNQPDKMREQLAAARVGGGGGGGGGEGAGGTHPVALYEAGEILRDARQFTRAEGLYQEAQAAARWWSEPPAALAELYLEMGEEDKAKAAFDESFRIDPYNLRARNQLTLLERLQQFATKESATRLKPGSDRPAFIVRYDQQDAILADLVMDWMEKIRPEVWGYFQVTDMPAPTLIELFPTHEQFGVRTTGLPWIGTVGASTGNVIAMDVPRGGAKNMMGAFDWARVLRHEYTHTVTLAMTNNRIPHWLTEAAACAQEEAPRDWENCQLLCSNYRAGTLFKIADLNWGFIRPKRTIDRQLAYMQSQWLYEYLVATYGQPKMIDFLHCFRDGLVEAQAWQKAYGKSMEAMDAEFRTWAGTQLESWGLPSDPLPKKAEVEAALKKNPADTDAQFKLAWLLASGGDNAGARKQLDALLAADPKHVKARELLGAVLNALKEKDKARDLLEQVVQDEPKRPVALRTLGLLAVGRKDLDGAVKWFTMLQQVRPLEETSYLNLAGVYLLRQENDKAIGQLLELERHEQKDERIPRKLADLYLAAKNLPAAENSAYRAIRINPYNAVNHQLMAQVLWQAGKKEASVTAWARAADLQPRVAEFWEGLANARGDTGDAAGAAAAAKKAVELQPDSKAATWIK